MPGRLAASTQQQVERSGEGQPPSALLPLPARLHRQTLGVGFALALLHAVMALLLECLEIHGASSFRMSRGLPVELPGW
jgi:hypothetical protein